MIDDGIDGDIIVSMFYCNSSIGQECDKQTVYQNPSSVRAAVRFISYLSTCICSAQLRPSRRILETGAVSIPARSAGLAFGP